MNEYNPMEELGLSEDRQFICSCNGVITTNNGTRDLCSKYMRNGDRIFDVLTEYEHMSVFPIKKGKEGATREVISCVTPFLKASGLTDHSAYVFFKNDLDIIPGAERTVRYLNGLEPFFINTSVLDHQMMSLSDTLGISMSNVNCSQASFDQIDMNKREAKEIRDMASKISKMDVKNMPDLFIDPNSPKNRKGWEMVETLDSMFLDRIPDMEFFPDLSQIVSIGANEKSYTLLEIRRQSTIDLDSTFYVGSGPSDRLVLDIVKDSGGLSVSFNGCAESVLNSDIAVMSKDATVIAVLAAEFYNEGIEAVHDLVDNWNIDHIKKKEGPDRHLLDTFLRTSKRLPEVVRLNSDNRDDVSERSDAYRRKMMNGSRKTVA